MPLRLNSSSLTCSICALAAIILQLVAMECRKLHMVDSPIGRLSFIKTGSVVSCLDSSSKTCKCRLNRTGLGLSPCLTPMFIENVSVILFPGLIQALSFLYTLCRTLRKWPFMLHFLLFINRMQGPCSEILSPRFWSTDQLARSVRKKRGLSISWYGMSNPVNK